MTELPVAGSAVLELMPVTPQPRASWGGPLPVSLIAPGRARSQGETFLSGCPGVSEGTVQDALLILSELVTNAVAATTKRGCVTPVYFSLRVFPDRLLIEVIDCSPELPLLKAPDDAATGGRGLCLVDALSVSWGYFRYQGRKVVFSTLPVGSEAEN